MNRILIAAAAVMLIIGVMAVPVSAGAIANNSGVPNGSKMVLNITLKVVNDEDSGFVGYWALDNYNKTVQVWQTSPGNFYAVVSYDGKWQTFAGALSPQNGVVEAKDAQGTLQGGYTATFTALGFISGNGNLGTVDYNGTKADILLGTYGAGQVGPNPSSSWLDTYFLGNSAFNYVNWGWTYHYQGQTWTNFASGSSGDIVT